MTIQYCLLAQAYGDSLGKFTEFLTAEQVQRLYPNGLTMTKGISNGHNDCWSRYEWTDDTDQTLLIIQACRTCHSLPDSNHDIYLREFANRLFGWYKHGFLHHGKKGCGIGDQIRWAINMPDYLKDPLGCTKTIWEDADREIRENGALMRTGIIGALFSNHDKIVDVATQITNATHYDPYCVCVSVFQSLLVRLLLDRKNNDLSAIVADCIALTDQYIGDTGRFLHDLLTPVLNGTYNPKYAGLDDPYYRGTINCSLPVAIWGLLNIKTKSYLTIIRTIAEQGGDADTNCAICGILLGTCISRSQLPDDCSNLNIKMLNDIINGKSESESESE
jgi:ADP-ribosylglycohydrolase